MAFTRRNILGASLGLGAACVTPRSEAQQGWPAHTIKIVVPFGLGGSADVIARYIAEQLREPLGTTVIVENRPGAGAVIGTDAVAKSPPDGYTLLAMSNTHTANETLLPNRPYELMRDLAPVAALNIAYNMLVVHPSVAAKTVPELIALAKAEPGKLNYASSGPGTPYHIIGEVFRAMAGIQLQHVPFRGSDQARTAIVGGTVHMMFDAIPTMLAQVRGGQVRGIATTGPERDPLTPELPTIADTLPGFDGPIWIALMAPAGTPKAIRERLNTEINRVLGKGTTREWQAKLGAKPLPMSVDELDEFLRQDIAKQRDWITKANIKVS
ncbi:MAG: hypothetical protein QOD74_317 [Variibacter sp.]|jgi:tripartite-type tricarboxylate transporter receptor subunit TctC|nr:hypothetical protein [Variibacter sp.]